MGLPSNKKQRKIEQDKLIGKQVDAIMKSEYYKERMKEWRYQDTLNAFVKLCVFSMSYLELNFNCKKNGLEKYLDHMKHSLDNLKEDDVFLKDARQYYIDEIGVDIFEKLGLSLKDEEPKGE